MAGDDEEAIGKSNGVGKPDDDGVEASATQAGTIKTSKKSAGKASADGPKQTKKRKADGEGDKEPKKKKLKKDEPPKPKMPKPKGPVDVEKQCGVVLPNGGNCARSLTCKSHSMGAKRAVPGRSMPYDQLLAAYQKKNQAKQQSKQYIFLTPLILTSRYHIGPRTSTNSNSTSLHRTAIPHQHIFHRITKHLDYEVLIFSPFPRCSVEGSGKICTRCIPSRPQCRRVSVPFRIS